MVVMMTPEEVDPKEEAVELKANGVENGKVGPNPKDVDKGDDTADEHVCEVAINDTATQDPDAVQKLRQAGKDEAGICSKAVLFPAGHEPDEEPVILDAIVEVVELTTDGLGKPFDVPFRTPKTVPGLLNGEPVGHSCETDEQEGATTDKAVLVTDSVDEGVVVAAKDRPVDDGYGEELTEVDGDEERGVDRLDETMARPEDDDPELVGAACTLLVDELLKAPENPRKAKSVPGDDCPGSRYVLK
ncbi:MAG: hypothetical protein M1822_002534 [Bathelium mastoideum]|nr:MAG: hypothetical protein M1822_002534 [Bathelium mastoideum]